MDYIDHDTALFIFGRTDDDRLPKFACGLAGCCLGKKSCCKSYKTGKRCKKCPKR
jgi:hypothetical protein